MSIERLSSLRDEAFRDFNSRLIPNIDKEKIIGVRTPALKALARELIKSGESEDLIKALPHEYFEEDQLHVFIISEINDIERAAFELERFLPYINNWATCDQLVIKAVAKEPERILPLAEKWLRSDHVYTARFAIGVLMRYFLDERFDEKYLSLVSNIRSEEYYLNMMCAWYFATALAKQWDKTYPYLSENKLPIWVHNKTIRKATESYRITAEQKSILKALITKQKVSNRSGDSK